MDSFVFSTKKIERRIRMANSKFKDVVSGIQASLVKHSPEILTGVGIAGMITTTVLAVRSTPKAMTLISEEKKRLGLEPEDKLKAAEVIKVTWKCYIPSAVTCATSIACLVGASSVHAKRNAVLATAYKLSETALTEYREKVIETIGEKKEQAIRDNLAKDRVEKEPVKQSEIIITETGSTLCFDSSTGRYFKSDMEKIKRAVNEINARMLRDDYASLNDFYDEIGIQGVKQGDELGWNRDKDGLLELYFSSVLDSNGTPCLVLDFKRPPKYEYNKFF